MNDSLNYIYYIFDKIISFVFNAEFFSGVSLGWVFLTILLFGIIMRTVLNVPRGLVGGALRRKGEQDE